MPNRVIKDSIKRSSEIDSLTWFQEVCFYRLMVTVDDNGCYHANPQILRSDLFPLKEDLTKKAVAEALDQLESSGLIERYEVDGKPFLHMKTWARHQRIRNKINHYPMPPQSAADDSELQQDAAGCGYSSQSAADCSNSRQLAANRRESRPESNPNPIQKEEEVEEERELTSPPPFIGDEEAYRVLEDQNEVLDALKDSGFPVNAKATAKYINLLSEHGKEKMLEAIDICVEHSVSKLDYLKAVLVGMGKEKSKAESTDDWDNLPLY